ncbi:hypothetical protein CF319_g4465 [Tilletia indica]|nr:hypothetical protein CF319_g4465 [Tilletia indica]
MSGSSISPSTAPWHVGPFDSFTEHRAYWSQYCGSSATKTYQYMHFNRCITTDRILTIRTLSLDVRAVGVHHSGIDNDADDVTSVLGGPLSDVVSILTRLSSTCFSLEEFNIRLPPYQPAVDAVEGIVARNIDLRRLHIDIDSTARIHQGRLIRLDLSNLVESSSTYNQLQKLVLRAPGTNVYYRNHDIHSPDSSLAQQRFIERLSTVTEFAIACSAFVASTPSWEFAHLLFRSAPILRKCEFSVYGTDNTWFNKTYSTHSTLHLLHLQDLVLQLPDVDSYLIRLVSAPGLLRLKIRSSIAVEQWPFCSVDQFPALAIVQILCPGPSFIRLDVLGIPQDRYERYCSEVHNRTFDHHGEFFAQLLPINDHTQQDLPPPFSVSDAAGTGFSSA